MAAGYWKAVGPWGSKTGGAAWTDGIYSEIKTIIIKHSTLINTIQVDYVIRGKDQEYLVSAPQHGNTSGTASTITLEKDEYITKVSGYYGYYAALAVPGDVVYSLKFTTSTGRTFGPYGKETGTAFESPDIPAKIVGFFGRSGDLVDQLGVYLLHF